MSGKLFCETCKFGGTWVLFSDFIAKTSIYSGSVCVFNTSQGVNLSYSTFGVFFVLFFCFFEAGSHYPLLPQPPECWDCVTTPDSVFVLCVFLGKLQKEKDSLYCSLVF